MISTLDLAWVTRAGGGGRTERRYRDFLVDGASLTSRIKADFISPFGWFDLSAQAAFLDGLLRKQPPQCAGGRTILCVCPECGDLGCGAVTVTVQGGPGVVIWRDFGIQNNYEDGVYTAGFEDIGPFTFDGLTYYRVLESLRASGCP